MRPSRPRSHRADEGRGQPREGEEVDLHGGFGLGLIEHRGKRVVGLAGVVHEAVEGTPPARRSANSSTAALSARSSRSAVERRARILRRELGGQRLRASALVGAVGESDVVAGRRQRADDRGAEAAPAAGDQHAVAEPSSRSARLPGHHEQTFCPPKPNEFEITRVTFASRATLGTTSSGIAGSGTW